MRICSRLLGTSGVVLLYNFFHANKPRPQHYRRAAETMIGLYFFSLFYMCLYSKEDSQSLIRHLPGGDTMQYVCVGLACLGFLSYISSYYVLDITYIMAPFVTVITVTIDCDIYYWTHSRGMDFWNQFRLLTDHLYIAIGLLMYITCSTRVTLLRDTDIAGNTLTDHNVSPKHNKAD